MHIVVAYEDSAIMLGSVACAGIRADGPWLWSLLRRKRHAHDAYLELHGYCQNHELVSVFALAEPLHPIAIKLPIEVPY